jgi:acetyltransferase
MHSGIELFAGAKREENFGHMIMCGLGGIFIEVLKDVQAGLAPLDDSEALGMIENLRGFKMIEGVRGMRGVDPGIYADILVRISHLVSTAPEIFEMDLNPMLGERESIIAVDARIRVEK